MIEEKLPPHDTEAEESVIGSLLLDPEAIFKVSLSPDEFFDDTNKIIYQACLNLHQKNEPIDQITVSHELMRMGKLEDIGGAAYLSHLISVTPTPFYIEHHAQLVSRTALMRQLIVNAGRIAALGYQDGDVDETIKKAEDLIYQVRSKKTTTAVSLKDALSEYFNESSPDKYRISTGFKCLDKIIGGLYKAELIVIASRPSQGKTSLALNISRHAIQQQKRVAFFSLEMPHLTLIHRLLAAEAGIDSTVVRAKRFTEKHEARLMESAGILADLNYLFIDDVISPTVTSLKSRARRLHHDQNIDLIVIDYIQLMAGEGRENRTQEVSHITNSLKGMAKDLNIPIVALSQLSREIEKRMNKEPQLSDLRESGSIEQDADVVMFLQAEENKDISVGIPTTIYVKKQRNGALGKTTLNFIREYSKFEEIE